MTPNDVTIRSRAYYLVIHCDFTLCLSEMTINQLGKLFRIMLVDDDLNEEAVAVVEEYLDAAQLAGAKRAAQAAKKYYKIKGVIL